MIEQDAQQLVKLLAQLEPGFYPLDIFHQFARLTVLPIVEFVPLRLDAEGKVEVLLLARNADDKFWPNQVHVPGTVVRPNDVSGQIYQPYQRIIEEELQSTSVSAPYYVSNLLHESKRGVEQAQVYWVEVTGDPKVGTFYPVNDLPANLIDSQVEFIAQAVQSFRDVKLQTR